MYAEHVRSCCFVVFVPCYVISCPGALLLPVVSCSMILSCIDSIVSYWCLWNKHSFCARPCPAVQQQKLLSSPRFGVLETNSFTCILLRRSVFSQTPVWGHDATHMTWARILESHPPWQTRVSTPNLPTKITPTKICWLRISMKFPMDMRIPPLEFKIMFESNPLTSKILVRRLAVSRFVPGGAMGAGTLAAQRVAGRQSRRNPRDLHSSSERIKQRSKSIQINNNNNNKRTILLFRSPSLIGALCFSEDPLPFGVPLSGDFCALNGSASELTCDS